jgi:hypothetical protein
MINRYGPPISCASVSVELESKIMRLPIPWFEKVCNGEDNAQYDANASNHNIRDSKERIFAAHDRPG